MPRYGAPRGDALAQDIAEVALDEPAHEHAERALAGTTSLSAFRTTSGSRVTTTSPPTCCERALDRAQVAGADVEDRDGHSVSVPLVDGIAPPQARVDPRGRIARAGERLEDALDHVVRVAAVVDVDVQVALRARRERREELLGELAVERADPLAFEAR